MESGATIQVVFNTFQVLPALLLKARLCVAPPIASNSTAQVFYCCVCSMPIDSEDAVVSWVKIVKIQLLNWKKWKNWKVKHVSSQHGHCGQECSECGEVKRIFLISCL